MRCFLLALIIGFFSQLNAQTEAKPPIDVLIRCDDIGMCHSVNMAAKEVLETGMPVSMSVMVPCPWFAEAAEMLKHYKNVSIGIHLTLNSEWKLYRWGPVSGAKAVPSLVDSLGYFFPSRAALFGNHPTLTDIETELRAQIDRALAAGLKIDYLDHHMSAAVETPESRALLEKLAKEYHLSISRYYGEEAVEGWYFAEPASKPDTVIRLLRDLQPGKIRLFVFHVGLNTPEMAAMEDANPWGPKDMYLHRNAERASLVAPAFQEMIKDGKYRLVNYGMLNKELGLEKLKRPS